MDGNDAMIERVARAICAQAYLDRWHFNAADTHVERHWPDHLAQARTALAAMGEIRDHDTDWHTLFWRDP